MIKQDWAAPIEAKAPKTDTVTWKIIVFCSILNMLLLWSAGLL